MINTSSKTLEAQDKTQDVKQSPSMKIGTKPCARSQRNELAEATGRWTGGSADRRPDAGGNRPDAGTQRSIEYSKVPERRNYDRTRPVAGDRTLAASDRWFAAVTVGTTGRVRSGRFSVRSVAELREFDPNGYFLSGAYKYNPQPAI